MQHPYSRKLDNLDLIEHFLSAAIGHEGAQDSALLNRIRSGEAELKNYDVASSTLYSSANRDRRYAAEKQRWALRIQIVEELATLPGEPDDDTIRLGRGGARPSTPIQKNRKALIITGLPASGKSGLAHLLAEHFGALILDPDYAKRKLPEFSVNAAGASLVHEESDMLIFGQGPKDRASGFRPLIELCSSEGYNVVIPKIGQNYLSLHTLARSLKSLGYETHLVLLGLDRQKATRRAIDRFQQTGRYVPLGLIFDAYANEPVLSFYRLKSGILLPESYIDTFTKLTADVEKGRLPKLVYADEKSPVSPLFKPD